MHCFLKYTDMKFDGSTSSFTHFIPDSDKSGINGKCFQSSFVPVAAGAVSEPGTGGTGRREVMPLPVLDITCWHWTGPFNVGHETYGVFISIFSLSSKSLPNVRACMCCATYPHTEIPQSVELSEVHWFSHGTWGQERKTPISGNSGGGRSEPFTSHAHCELTQNITGFKGLTSVRVV